MSAFLSITATLGNGWETLGSLTQSMLRATVGLLLVPHGLRVVFGLFPDSGLPTKNMAMFIASLEQTGYRPGWLWGWLIAATHLICGPLLVLGLFTRLAAIPVVIFLFVACFERWRVGGWFWNTLGMEYTALWWVAAVQVLVVGPGPLALDHAFGWPRP